MHAMAVGAVCVQVGARPIVPVVPVGGCVVRIGERGLRLGCQWYLDQANMRQRVELGGRDAVVVVLFVQLRHIKGQRGTGPPVVASLAFGTAGEAPRLLAFSAGGMGVNDVEGVFAAGGVQQQRIRLLVVPLKCVRMPLAAVEVQDLRFHSATTGWIAVFHVERDGLHQH